MSENFLTGVQLYSLERLKMAGWTDPLWCFEGKNALIKASDRRDDFGLYTGVEIKLSISLHYSSRKACYLLSGFDLDIAKPELSRLAPIFILSPIRFLMHLGKRFPNDSDIENPSKYVYEVSIGRSMQDFFDSYDHMAKDIGKLTMFSV